MAQPVTGYSRLQVRHRDRYWLIPALKAIVTSVNTKVTGSALTTAKATASLNAPALYMTIPTALRSFSFCKAQFISHKKGDSCQPSRNIGFPLPPDFLSIVIYPLSTFFQSLVIERPVPFEDSLCIDLHLNLLFSTVRRSTCRP